MDIILRQKSGTPDSYHYEPLYPKTNGDICSYDNNSITATSTNVYEMEKVRNRLSGTTVEEACQEIEERVSSCGRQMKATTIPYYIDPISSCHTQSLNGQYMVVANLNSPIFHMWNGSTWKTAVFTEPDTLLGTIDLAIQDVACDKVNNTFYILTGTRLAIWNTQTDTVSFIDTGLIGANHIAVTAVSTTVYIWVSTYSSGDTSRALIYSATIQNGSTNISFSSKYARTTGTQEISHMEGTHGAYKGYLHAILVNDSSTSLLTSQQNQAITTNVIDTASYGNIDYMNYGGGSLHIFMSNSSNQIGGYYRYDYPLNGLLYSSGTLTIDNKTMSSIISCDYYEVGSDIGWTICAYDQEGNALIATSEYFSIMAWQNTTTVYDIYPTCLQNTLTAGDFTLGDAVRGDTDDTTRVQPICVVWNPNGSWATNQLYVLTSSGHMIETSFTLSPRYTATHDNSKDVQWTLEDQFWRKIISSPYYNSGSVPTEQYIALGSIRYDTEFGSASGIAGTLSIGSWAESCIATSIDGENWIACRLSDTVKYTDILFTNGAYWCGGIGTDSLPNAFCQKLADYTSLTTYTDSTSKNYFNRPESWCTIATNRLDVMFTFGDSVSHLRERDPHFSTARYYGYTEFYKGDIDNSEIVDGHITGSGLYLGIMSAVGSTYVAPFAPVSTTSAGIVAIEPNPEGIYSSQVMLDEDVNYPRFIVGVAPLCLNQYMIAFGNSVQFFPTITPYNGTLVELGDAGSAIIRYEIDEYNLHKPINTDLSFNGMYALPVNSVISYINERPVPYLSRFHAINLDGQNYQKDLLFYGQVWSTMFVITTQSTYGTDTLYKCKLIEV